MKKSELEALGLDGPTIKAVQEIHGQDLQRIKEKCVEGAGAPASAFRTAIASMLPMITQRNHLKELLSHANRLYFIENRDQQKDKKTAADAANTDDGKEAVKVATDTASTISQEEEKIK